MDKNNPKISQDSNWKQDSLNKRNSLKVFWHELCSEKILVLSIPRQVWVIAGLVSSLFFIFYIISASAFAVGYAHSDELLATAYQLGLGRPPGQPIYILLLHFFLNLPLPMSVVMRGNLLSALLQSLTIFFSFVSVWIVLKQISISKAKNIFALFDNDIDLLFYSGISVSLIALTQPIWTYGAIAETVAFSSFLISLILNYILRLFIVKSARKDLIILAIIYGIAVANFPPSIFLLPLVLITFRVNVHRYKLKPYQLLLIFIFVLALNIGLIIALSYSNAVLSWKLERSPFGLWQYFTDNHFGQNQLLVQFGRRFADAIPVFIEKFSTIFGWLLIVLMLLGLRWVSLAGKRMLAVIFLGTGLLGLIYPILLNWSDDRFTQILILRQYAMTLIIWAIPLAGGIYLLMQRTSKAIALLSPSLKYWRIFVVLTISVILITRVNYNFKNYNLDNLKNFGLIKQSNLESIPRESMLVCVNDLSCGSLYFAQQVLGLRRDIIIIPKTFPLSAGYLQNQNLTLFNYIYQPYIFFDHITWNLDKRRVFMIGTNQSMYDILGMNYGFSYFVPNGFYGEITRKLPDKLPTYDQQLSSALRLNLFDQHNLGLVYQQELLGQTHMFNALIYQRMGQRELAREELNRSSNLFYEIDAIPAKKIENYRVEIENQAPAKNWELGSQSQTAATIMQEVNRFISQNKINSALMGAMGAVAIEPRNVEARLLLASIYEEQDNEVMAKIEYQNILKLDPSNMQAGRKLQTLDDN